MLDASVQTQELMLELKREFDLTYLFITHDLWVAILCDRIAVMNAGRIVELGPPRNFYSTPAPIYPNSAPLNQRIWSYECRFKLIGNTTPGWLL